ncbi:MAG TPA: TrmH family RNA methyltransferase [Conexibacter sp.]|nr:TrmH family RNA methyltransferase [Conexibacter sp.]
MTSVAREAEELVRRFRTARRASDVAVLEGFHALKHALRFDAHVVTAVTSDADALELLAAELAPDLREALLRIVEPVDEAVLARITPRAPRTAVVAVARRPRVAVAEALRNAQPSPVVLLEDPRDLGNVGACVRVAAAADAAAVLTTGTSDPWHPDAVRGAAGLQYAVPVARIDALPPSDRPLFAIDPDGDELDPRRLPARAILAFGTERSGLSEKLLRAADARIRIPMRSGVSSLNLATSVAAVLFVRRLCDARERAPLQLSAIDGRAQAM